MVAHQNLNYLHCRKIFTISSFCLAKHFSLALYLLTVFLLYKPQIKIKGSKDKGGIKMSDVCQKKFWGILQTLTWPRWIHRKAHGQTWHRSQEKSITAKHGNSLAQSNPNQMGILQNNQLWFLIDHMMCKHRAHLKTAILEFICGLYFSGFAN